MRKSFGIIFAAVLMFSAQVFAKDNPVVTLDSVQLQNNQHNPHGKMPVYVAELSNINDYNIFANSGWDGSWYAGYNVCWMEELGQIPKWEYSKAFIGVKLGRMKTRPVPGKAVWEKEPIPGDIYVALSTTSSWKSDQKYFLASTKDIPLEGDNENALEGVGEARWFWAEVPVENINLEGSNYIALWSPTEYFVSTASSPVLAGGWGSNYLNTWMNNDIRGYPPLKAANALKTGITVFEPAIALKLVPKGCEQEIRVAIADVKDGRKKTANKTFIAAVLGNEIECAWLELSTDGKSWQRITRYEYSAPYMITIKPETLPTGSLKIRCAARDIWGNAGYSTPAEIKVSK